MKLNKVFNEGQLNFKPLMALILCLLVHSFHTIIPSYANLLPNSHFLPTYF